MIQRIVFTISLMLAFAYTGISQKYYSKTARIYFLSEAAIETIEATNNSGYLVMDAVNGQLEMSVLIKGFHFEKSLMQTHFNENYMESDQYPKAFFKGRIMNISTLSLTEEGMYQADVQGNLTIHGITKPFSTKAKLLVNGGKVSVHGSFDIAIGDFGIQVPKVVRENIAKEVNVSISADLQKM